MHRITAHLAIAAMASQTWAKVKANRRKNRGKNNDRPNLKFQTIPIIVGIHLHFHCYYDFYDYMETLCDNNNRIEPHGAM